MLSFAKINAQMPFLNENSFKITRTLDYLNSLYVDTVNQSALAETAIRAMVKELDPHSAYLNVDEVKELNEPLQGNFEGIGVSFNILNDTIFIINTIAGGPSEKVGVMGGDRIIKIDGELVAGIKITNKTVFKKLRGNKGTKVVISVLRKGSKNLIDFTITRDRIPIYSIDAAYMLNKEIGYIKLDRFSQTTNEEFAKALKKLQSQKMKSLILDLTGNGGGLLDEAAMLADQFLDKDKLLVYTKGRKARRQEFFSTSQGLFEKGKLVLMIDENSASASEILSGAIQDWDRGIIVGRRSFGKGLVQRPLMYPDGSMLKLTIAHYYTPSGRDIQRPYKNGNSDDYYNDFVNRYKHNELSNKDSIHFVDSLKKSTLVQKRTVFGGGGIMPDIFVPIDTSMYSDYYRDLLRNGTIYKFVLNYIDTNRTTLKKQYPDFQKFNTLYSADQLFPAIIEFANKDSIKFNQQQFDQSKNAISRLLKAYIARDIWESSEFFQVFNADDPIIKEAIKAIEQYDSIIFPTKK